MNTKITSDSSGDLMHYIAEMDNRLSDRTKREYTTRLKEISKKIHLDGGTLTPDMVIIQLNKLVATNEIAQSTFRIYKAAIMYWIGQQAQALMASGDDYGDYARTFLALRDIRHAQLARGAERTSAKKLKAFPKECLDSLIKYAEDRGHRAPNAVRAAAFAKANLLVGLRPVEWFDASLATYFRRNEDGIIMRDIQGRIQFEYMLVVNNAKATHGRGNGKQRELVLHEITADELKALMHFLDIVTKFKERHPADIETKKLTNLLYRPMNNMIRRSLAASGYAARDIPSVYSTRHQVVADFKASGIGKREIAAFFGHSSDATHREHYGRKRSGSRGVTFQASLESVMRVTDRSMISRPDAIPPELAIDAEMWMAEQISRKTPST